MRAIFKFPISLADKSFIEVQEGADFLTAQLQGNTLVIWASVDPEAPKHRVCIGVVGTGHLSNWRATEYLSTVQIGPLVWHVFVEGGS